MNPSLVFIVVTTSLALVGLIIGRAMGLNLRRKRIAMASTDRQVRAFDRALVFPLRYLEELGDMDILDKERYRPLRSSVAPGEPFVGELTAPDNVVTITGPRLERQRRKHASELSLLDVLEE